jgi:hypothetical protein
MRCDYRASLLACTLASPDLGREPKVRVAIIIFLLKPTKKDNKKNVLFE